MASKYNKLNQYLKNYSFTIKYKEIEDILGQELPRSAYVHRAWWSNSGHDHAKTWKDAGWKVDNVELGKTVSFKIDNK
jgi:hypothetical protein